MGFNPARDLPDLTGRVAIVTGATSGIGFATAQALVLKGAKVYLAARSEEKAKACIARIEADAKIALSTGSGKGEALFHHLELSDPKEAKKSAEAFAAKEGRLDILINNAAMTIVDYKVGSLGVQEIMVVNFFSPFVFTNTLLPLLKQTSKEPGADVRIVNVSEFLQARSDTEVSSDGHNFAPKELKFKTKEDFNVSFEGKFMASLRRYAVSKLLGILWSRELERRLTSAGDNNIIVIVLDPGVVMTEGVSVTAARIPWPLSTIYTTATRLLGRTPLSGAGTSLLASAAAEYRTHAEKYKGAYLVPIGNIGKTSKLAESSELAVELWDTAEKLLKEWGA